jgi:predicted nucleotidyltransferase
VADAVTLDLAWLRARRGDIERIAAQHGAEHVRVFGSVARGDATADSDVDLLVTMAAGRSYLDFVAFWQDVEALLRRRVDVVSDRAISPYIKASVREDAVDL